MTPKIIELLRQRQRRTRHHHKLSRMLKKENKVKNPRTKRSYPPTSEMVNNAIKGLKARGGSSLQTIKKYIAAYYKVDAEKVAPFIKKYFKSSVASGALVQTKGKGASGSFKLAASSSSSADSAAKPTGAEKKRNHPLEEKQRNRPPNELVARWDLEKKRSLSRKHPQKALQRNQPRNLRHLLRKLKQL